jgi:hypothetical protein
MKTKIHSASKGSTTGRYIARSIFLRVAVVRAVAGLIRILKNEV